MRLDFDMGGGRTPKPQPGAPRDRPWRKSAAAVAAERQEVTDRHSNPQLCRSDRADPGFARCQARRLLGASGGVDLAALRYALAVQEAIDAAEAVQAAMHDKRCLTATQLLAPEAAAPRHQVGIGTIEGYALYSTGLPYSRGLPYARY